MSSEDRCIVDTVVPLYFLLVGEEDLLCDLLGTPIRVPIAVYDPDDRSLPPEAMRRSEYLSEMRQSARHYEVAATADIASRVSLERVRRVDDLFDGERLTVVEMSETEARLAAELQSREGVAGAGLRAALGPGESACVAIAWERAWTIVTDDDAPLGVLDHLHGERSYPYERIRKLLIRAATEKRLSKSQANELHAEMVELGFWDAGTPFPDSPR